MSSPYRHLISIDALSISDITNLMTQAAYYEKHPYCTCLQNKIVGNLFFEPSTRTHCSFQAAIQRCGGSSIDLHMQYSSMKKGETWEDTVKTMEQYCDILVIRHPEKGVFEKCTPLVQIPIINAGDGIGEHPTQALLDLYTIQQSHDIWKQLHIAFCGDLKHSRTCHSLIRLLDRLQTQITFYFVSDSFLQLDDTFVSSLRNQYVYESDLETVLPVVDVLYMTRLQKERMEWNNQDENEKKGSIQRFQMTNERLNMAKPTMILMHPLPRNEELSVCCDTNPRSKYFQQMKNGVYVRMAILRRGTLYGEPRFLVNPSS